MQNDDLQLGRALEFLTTPPPPVGYAFANLSTPGEGDRAITELSGPLELLLDGRCCSWLGLSFLSANVSKVAPTDEAWDEQTLPELDHNPFAAWSNVDC